MIKAIAIAVVILIGLMDYALVVACSRWEDRAQYYHEKHLKDERNKR